MCILLLTKLWDLLSICWLATIIDFSIAVLKNSGINKSIKNPEYIISLTSYPGRINSVSVCIETIMRQTVLADRLYFVVRTRTISKC